jgi:hypothetical protein
MGTADIHIHILTRRCSQDAAFYGQAAPPVPQTSGKWITQLSYHVCQHNWRDAFELEPHSSAEWVCAELPDDHRMAGYTVLHFVAFGAPPAEASMPAHIYAGFVARLVEKARRTEPSTEP